MAKREAFNLGNYIADAVPELSALPAVQGARTLEVIGAEIREHTASMEYHVRGTIYEAVEIGRRLAEARDIAPHGTWLDFLKRETAFSHDKANNLIKVFEAYGEQQKSLFGTEVSNSDTYRNLSFSKALALLALPEGERETFVETHDVEEMSTRELKAAIRERDEARQALASARAEVNKAAEYVAAKEAETTALASERDAMAETARMAAEKAKAATDEAIKIAVEVNQLRAQIKELESRPVDVAVMEVDAETIAKAKAEAVAEMQEKLDKAKAAKAKADEKRKQAEETLEVVKVQLAEAAKARKDAEISADKELATFQVFFNQGQELANKMRGILLKIRGREDQETAGKLEAAIRALGNAIGRAAE